MNKLLWCLICWYILLFINAAPRIEMDRRKAVVNLPLTITCTSEVTITTTVTFFIKPVVSKGACLTTGTCASSISRYSVTQNRAQRTTTLTISSVNSTADTGTWFCQQEVGEDSGNLTITQFATVLDWSSVSFTPSLSSLPSSVTPKQTVTVTVTTPCAAPQASFNWTYQQGVSGSPPGSTSTSQRSCPPGQVQTINTLSLPGNTPSLFNRQISLTVSVEHDSFDPPSYTRSATSRSIQFPVPVTSVTMQEISSDNETVGGRLGTDLTLTCVTSASFPTSTVSWSGLPSGTTPTSTSTSGLLKTTTSSVTFTLSKSDQGRTVRCTASNIAGQTSPQTNRAVLEVQCETDPNTTSSSLAGPVVGAVFGVLAFCVVGVGLFVLCRRGYRCYVAKQGHQQSSSNQESQEANTAVGQNATYASLENTKSQDYTELRLYENSKGQKKTSQTPPDVYANASQHTYMNAQTKHKDSTYENTSFSEN